MNIIKAELSDINTVFEIVRTTISAIYPRYYPKGAVDFFLAHHCKANIIADIENDQVFVCCDTENTVVGTVTVKNNEICRLFVLPKYQGNGYGRKLLDFAESSVSKAYSEIYLDASLPAKKIYIKRGYEEIEYNTIETKNGDFLCYDFMVRRI